MKFTIDWLKDHLKTNKTEAQIIEKLNSTGLEVAGLTYPTSDGSNGQFLKTCLLYTSPSPRD